MYAIIEIGGKQYKIEKGDVINIERQDKKEGQAVSLNKVLLLVEKDEVEVGQPYIKGAKVEAEVIKNFKASKVISYKYRRRKASHWKKGHRQLLTKIKIKELAAK
ncbi:MAG: 50S ribosomal protein L21 [Candidatus Omnitrophica bacterium]|nr:50S ribosomal protein L21 [Candidatus Omnitrophota bacterium]